ncbi:tRNA epoxyqueuosine(34) reductase QueG [Hugenholtzia roseola]|uniref:tRNA epoxyqueuosine(34) reductase QueG n=1 Tax=Hugenholtzia roseola TaxID=1002 RepID=UPI00040FD3D4|nr:tRNA epoxyqueuosine(34) reductase QueG [Hugenholtzia roseola]
MANPIKLQADSDWLKEKARELGFLHCGIAQADFLEEEAPRLEKWLAQQKQGEMQWMENHFEKRLDPRLLVEGAKTVISLSYNYFPEKELFDAQSPYRVSKYAYGKDYHKVVKKKLNSLMQALQARFGDFVGRAFVDSAPVMDKIWAKKAGIGWQGKHSNLIAKKEGSFFFLAEIICDLSFQYDSPIRDYCGNCTLCIDACPTEAIVEPYVVDGSRCISYFTIELKKEIPADMGGLFQNWVFGCDICQDVCPWNRRSKPHQEPDFLPSEGVQALSVQARKEWQAWHEESFERLFVGSALKRTKWSGLKRNLDFIDTFAQVTPPDGKPEAGA